MVTKKQRAGRRFHVFLFLFFFLKSIGYQLETIVKNLVAKYILWLLPFIGSKDELLRWVSECKSEGNNRILIFTQFWPSVSWCLSLFCFVLFYLFCEYHYFCSSTYALNTQLIFSFCDLWIIPTSISCLQFPLWHHTRQQKRINITHTFSDCAQLKTKVFLEDISWCVMKLGGNFFLSGESILLFK